MPLSPTLPTAPRPIVLLIENDTVVSELLQYNLSTEYTLLTARTEAEALTAADGVRLSLVIVGTADADYARIARSLCCRDDSCRVPMVILSGRDAEDDIVAGFAAGADDYIVKPFSLRELMARVRALVRRSEYCARSSSTVLAKLSIDGLHLDNESQRVIIDEQEVSLTRTEFMILSLLMRNQGRNYTRRELQECIWGREPIADRTVDVNISRLRKKMGIYAPLIVSNGSLGYGIKPKS